MTLIDIDQHCEQIWLWDSILCHEIGNSRSLGLLTFLKILSALKWIWSFRQSWTEARDQFLSQAINKRLNTERSISCRALQFDKTTPKEMTDYFTWEILATSQKCFFMENHKKSAILCHFHSSCLCTKSSCSSLLKNTNKIQYLPYSNSTACQVFGMTKMKKNQSLSRILF